MAQLDPAIVTRLAFLPFTVILNLPLSCPPVVDTRHSQKLVSERTSGGTRNSQVVMSFSIIALMGLTEKNTAVIYLQKRIAQ